MSTVSSRKTERTPADQIAGRGELLLAWYDRHRRELPWRARAGERSNAYRVWLSEIMLQQTTVKAVGPYFERFVRRWPTVEALGEASLDDVLRMWAGLGYYSRARNLHACAVAVTRAHGGRFPDTEAGLRELPGVGPYTAAAIAAIAFDRATMPVDGNIERVVSRVFAVEDEPPKAKPRIQALAQTLLPQSRPGDAAQALMDLGATTCTPKKPACVLCPLIEGCAARGRGDQDTFPRKAAKKTGKLRRGAAFIVTRGSDVLLRSRPVKGLLGGMTEVPTSEWLAQQTDRRALAEAPKLAGIGRWHRKAGVVTHVFTHFPLELVVYTSQVPAKTHAPDGTRWVSRAALEGEALPNVMRKVLAHGLGT
jgi:A/G-specific adenine glycosylase